MSSGYESGVVYGNKPPFEGIKAGDEYELIDSDGIGWKIKIVPLNESHVPEQGAGIVRYANITPGYEPSAPNEFGELHITVWSGYGNKKKVS